MSYNHVGSPETLAYINGFESDNATKDKRIAELEARIDALMLEYCPDEMTEAQLANWAKHQRPVSKEEAAIVNSILLKDAP